MRTLTTIETNEVAGGILPGILLGVAGAYVYDSIGGKEGIDRYLSDSFEAFSSSVEYWYNQVT